MNIDKKMISFLLVSSLIIGGLAFSGCSKPQTSKNAQDNTSGNTVQTPNETKNAQSEKTEDESIQLETGTSFRFLKYGPLTLNVSSYQSKSKRTLIEVRNTSKDIVNKVKLNYEFNKVPLQIIPIKDLPGRITPSEKSIELSIGTLAPGSWRRFWVQGEPLDEIRGQINYNEQSTLLNFR